MARGGKAIPIPCDHEVDAQIDELFSTIKDQQGRLDLLVNNAYKGMLKDTTKISNEDISTFSFSERDNIKLYYKLQVWQVLVLMWVNHSGSRTSTLGMM